MGLSINYSGSIKDPLKLPALIEEVQDIAKIFQWHYHIFEQDFPATLTGKESFDDNIYGISISPPECEPVWFSFLSNGRMSSPVNVSSFANSNIPEYKDYLYMLSTKTQYAGIEIHQQVIHLMKYIDSKYLQHFTVMDEGQYWETSDRNVLAENFERYNIALNSFSSAIKNHPLKPGENLTSYFERLINLFKGKE